MSRLWRSQHHSNGWIKSDNCPDSMSHYTNPDYPGIQIKSLDVNAEGKDRWTIWRGHTQLDSAPRLAGATAWVGANIHAARDNLPCYNEVRRFWFIFVDDGQKLPQNLYRHNSLAEGQTELSRLAKANPGKKFTLMCSVVDMIAAPAVRDEYREHV